MIVTKNDNSEEVNIQRKIAASKMKIKILYAKNQENTKLDINKAALSVAVVRKY